MIHFEDDTRLRRLKRKSRVWPKWLRSKIVRWALIAGPHVDRLWRFIQHMFGDG